MEKNCRASGYICSVSENITYQWLYHTDSHQQCMTMVFSFPEVITRFERTTITKVKCSHQKQLSIASALSLNSFIFACLVFPITFWNIERNQSNSASSNILHNARHLLSLNWFQSCKFIKIFEIAYLNFKKCVSKRKQFFPMRESEHFKNISPLPTYKHYIEFYYSISSS